MTVECLPWGKGGGESASHRLEHHCADVAAYFETLLGEPILRRRFAAIDDHLTQTPDASMRPGLDRPGNDANYTIIRDLSQLQ